MFPCFNPQDPSPPPSIALPAQQNNGMIANIQQQLHGPNQQFQQPVMPGALGQNAHVANFQGNAPGMLSRPPGFSGVPNGQFMMQNGILSNMNYQSQSLNPLQAMVLQGQLLNALQNLSQLSAMQFQGQLNMNGIWSHSLAPPMNHVAGLIPQNPMLMTNKSIPIQSTQNNLGFVQGIDNKVPSSHSLVATSSLSGTIISSDSTQRPFDRQRRSTGPMASNLNNESVTQISGHPNSSQLTRLQVTQMASQPSQFQHTQYKFTGNIGNDISQFNSGNSSCQSLTRNPPEFWKRDQTRDRCQKPQYSLNSNRKENCRPIAGNKGKGPQNRRERPAQLPKFNQNPYVSKRRPPCVNYTEQEIQLWREARRRNYPTAAKIIGKKERNSAVTDGDTKLRRQQLKEVLAKQAELGVEVAELPPNYLSESENKTFGGDVNKTSHKRNDRFQGKFIDKGRRVNRHAKRPKLRNDGPAACVPIKREPTLLQKLLHAEIERDKSKLLQVFRFVTLNSFFKDWPAKPLVFPQVILKDAVHGEADVKDNCCDSINGTYISDGEEDFELHAVDNEVCTEDGIIEGDSSSCSDDLEKENVLCEELDKSEEGEITE